MEERNDTPGPEIPKEYRKIAKDLVKSQGWRYDRNPKGKHPTLFPPDVAQDQLPVPTTPSKKPTALRNFVSEVRRRGGVWPPPKSQKPKKKGHDDDEEEG